MKNIFIIINFTLREALARKVFIFFIAVSALFLIGLGFAFSLMDSSQILTTINPANDEFILGQAIGLLEVSLITPLSLLCLLLAIFSTASFVPNMLEKGNIDLLLSKPISRLQLIIGKYLGSILFIFINIGLLILGVWLMISLKFSYWDASFLWSVVIITFTYAVLYSIIVLFGIITKSSVFGMMIAYFIYLILSPALLFVKSKVEMFSISDFFKEILKGLYYIFPKTSELMSGVLLDVSTGKSIVDYQPIITSSVFLILILGYGVFLFTRKDF
jgi:ABC-type transport system involved in multi-copper enzyme maturation permease subunit